MSVIINEFRRTTGTFLNTEYIEFLLIEDQTALQLESLFFGDSQIATTGKVGTFQLANLSSIAPLFKAGTLIVIGGTAIAQDITYNPSAVGTNDDWNIQLNPGGGLINTVRAGGDFANGDVVWLDNSSTGTTLIHAIAWSSAGVFGTFGTAATVQIPLPRDGESIEYMGNGTQLNQAADYTVTSNGSIGLPNVGNNATYINTLRNRGVTAGVTVTPSSGSTEVSEAGATTETYAIALNTPPTTPVTIQIAASDGQTEVSLDGATFASSVILNLGSTTPGTITVRAIDDPNSEGDHSGVITHTITSGDPAYSEALTPIPPVSIAIADNDTPGITVSPTTGTTSEAGVTTAFTVVLDTQPTAPVTLNFQSDHPTEGIVSNPLTFTPANWNSPQTVTVTGVDDASNDGDVIYNLIATATSDDPAYNNLAPVSVAITNTDNDINSNNGTIGIVITQTDGSTSITSGSGTDTYDLALSSIPDAPVTVTIDPEDEVDLGAGPGNPIALEFAADATALIPQTVTVTAITNAIAGQRRRILHTVTSADPNYNGSGVPITVDGTLTAEVTATITNTVTAPNTPAPPDTDTPDTSTTTPNLRNTANNVFQLEGGSEPAQLQFTLTESNASWVSEIGVFVVDDENGTVNGIAPGTLGYQEAALNRAQVIFSALAGNFVANPTRIIDGFNAGERLVFYLVPNGTTESVLAGQDSSVRFAPAPFNPDGFGYLRVSEGNGGFDLAWEDQPGDRDQDFNDLVLNVQLTNEPPPLGTGQQGQRELVDLRDQSALVASFEARSEALFNNTVGLYVIEDERGTVIDPVTGTSITPGEAGYGAAAIRQTVMQSGRDVTGSVPLDSGALLAPYLIANGTAADFLAASDNPNSQGPLAYFAYLSANPGSVDHIRLLGDNTFGFEDLLGGGDRDFNDMVFHVDFA